MAGGTVLHTPTALNAQSDLHQRLGARFTAVAINVGERIDVRGLESRLASTLPVIVEVPPSGCAVLLRAGAVIVFGLDRDALETYLASIAPRIQGPYKHPETERVRIRVADADRIESEGIAIGGLDVERLQLIAEIMGKSVILARHELEITETFRAIEPMALKMRACPNRSPWRQRDLITHIGAALLVEHALVGRAEVLEKPDLLWDRPDLERLGSRLAEEYELRDRYLALDAKVEVVSRTAQTMLDLSQARRALNVEWYIVALIALDILIVMFETLR